MKAQIALNDDNRTPKYQQIVDSIMQAICLGKLKKGDQVSSINEISDEFLLARETVRRAYDILRTKGVVVSVKGKGFYINRTDLIIPFKILLIFNKISNYKKQVYNAFVQTLGDKAIVDLKVHHFNTKIFEALIMDNLLNYDYFVIMPHFYDNPEEAQKIIQKIPDTKLVILDKDIPYRFTKYSAAYQDFRNDIMQALEECLDHLKKYNKLILVQPKMIPYPPELTTGFTNFCRQQEIEYEVISEVEVSRKLRKKEVYIVIEELDLVNLIKNCRNSNLKIGKDIGIISYNETPLKEILLDGITVISTDHAKMGETAAKLILENRREKIKNPFQVILRKSL